MHYNVDFFLIITRGAHELHVYLGILGFVSEPNETRIEFIGQKVWKSAVNTVRNRVLGQPPVLGHGYISARRWPTVTLMALKKREKLDL